MKEIVATQSPARSRQFLMANGWHLSPYPPPPPPSPQHFTFINFTVRVSDGVLDCWQRVVLAKILDKFVPRLTIT